MRNLLLAAAMGFWCALAQAADGEYLARAGDCVACHTSSGGAFMAGGVPFDTPFGKIYSTNITPDKTHGIGEYSYEDFARAMREGVTRKGHGMYPAMPYTSYALINDEDMHALYDYFMQQVPAQAIENRASEIAWPFSMRWPLRIWAWLFNDGQVFVADKQQSDQYNRGAYLVKGLGHCGACHTPRGWALQEQANAEKSPLFLSGAVLDGWFASDLRHTEFKVTELVQLLQTGRSERLAVSGPMADVISHSTQYLTEQDLTAIATYLVDIAQDAPQTSVATPAEAAAGAAGMYASYCSTCHGKQGEGSAFVVPALAGNPTVTAHDPQSLLQVLLKGSHSPRTRAHIGYGMPGYAWTLDDTKLAALANYLRSSWGNQGSAVSAAQVSALRGTERAH